MEFEFKKEWKTVGVDIFESKIRELLSDVYLEVEPIWRQLLESVYHQIIDSYYQYEPYMYERRESLYRGYEFSLSRHNGITESKDRFVGTGVHSSITGEGFSDDAITAYVMMGHRSIPPWACQDSRMTYIASVHLPQIGFSMVGYSPDIWEAADKAVTEYIEDEVIHRLTQKAIGVFFDSIGEYCV